MSIQVVKKGHLLANLEFDEGLDFKKGLLDRAQNGDPKALYDVGLEHYYYGSPRELSVDWFMLAAKMGSDVAEYQLGLMYSNGYGVFKDDYASFSWYLKAAKKLNKDAWFRIAQMFNYGEAVPRDQYKALEWFYRYNKNGVHVRSLEKQGLHLAQHDKNRSVTQLIKEAKDILNAEIEKDREQQDEMLKDREKKPRSKKPTKEELKKNFDPFVFHAKRK